MANFLASKQQVERHNAQGGSSYKMGLNHMSDWTQEELAKLVAVKPGSDALLKAQAKANLSELATFLDGIMMSSIGVDDDDEFDWRTVPERVGPVKDQGQCASGYAFAATGLLEGQLYKHGSTGGKLVPLSEQELVDCTTDPEMGCFGNTDADAINKINAIGGLETESDYPYEAHDNVCRFHNKSVITVATHKIVTYDKDEKVIKQTLRNYGPVSAEFKVTVALTKYQSGVFADKTCSSPDDMYNHHVLLVGYGTDPNEGDYWIVKNSWGTEWGEQGYFRVKRGVNMCGLAKFPIIAQF